MYIRNCTVVVSCNLNKKTFYLHKCFENSKLNCFYNSSTNINVNGFFYKTFMVDDMGMVTSQMRQSGVVTKQQIFLHLEFILSSLERITEDINKSSVE